jgi:PAS domain S-box-containing protein
MRSSNQIVPPEVGMKYSAGKFDLGRSSSSKRESGRRDQAAGDSGNPGVTEQEIGQPLQITDAVLQNEELGVWQIRPDGLTEYANSVVYALLDIESPDILESHSYTEFFTPESQDALKAVFADCMAGKIGRCDAVLLSTHGPQRDVRFSCTPISGEDGSPVGVAATLRDITSQRRVEQSAAESDLKYRQLFMHGSDAVIALDLAGIVSEVNNCACNLLGYRREELTGASARLLTHPDDPDLLSHSGMDERLECRLRQRDGQYVVAEVSLCRLPEVGCLLVARDVSERKQREQRLSRLAETAVEVHSLRTLEDVLQLITDRAAEIVGAHIATAGMTLAADWARAISALHISEKYADLPRASVVPGNETLWRTVTEANRPVRRTQFEMESSLEDASSSEEKRPQQLTGGWLAAPLVGRDGRNLGIIQLADRVTGEFTAEDEAILVQFAQMAAAAIENVRLFQAAQEEIAERRRAEERTRRHYERLVALHATDIAIVSSLDLSCTLEVFLQQVTQQLNVDAAAVLLYSASDQALILKQSTEPAAALSHKPIPLGCGPAGQAAVEQRLMHCVRRKTPSHSTWDPLAGQDTYESYCAVPLVARGQIRGVLELYLKTRDLGDPEWLSFMEILASQGAVAIDNARLFEELCEAYDATIEGWSRALDLRDKETEGHSRRVTEMTLGLAKQLGVSPAELVHMRRGALLHDIGKMGVPDSILLKPGALTRQEWEIMRLHPEFAYEMLAPVTFLRPALEIPYSHHEMWDGTGYPQGLKGEAIPLAARIFAVADVWDALNSDRPYRKAWPKERIREHIRALAGKHFDPAVVDAFLHLKAEEL